MGPRNKLEDNEQSEIETFFQLKTSEQIIPNNYFSMNIFLTHILKLEKNISNYVTPGIPWLKRECHWNHIPDWNTPDAITWNT